MSSLVDKRFQDLAFQVSSQDLATQVLESLKTYCEVLSQWGFMALTLRPVLGHVIKQYACFSKGSL